LLWYDSAEHGQRRYYKGIGNTLQPEFTSEKPQARVLADLDHAFSVMALCKRGGYSHVTLRRPEFPEAAAPQVGQYIYAYLQSCL